MFAAMMLLATQQIGTNVEPVERVGERLYHLYPITACNRRIAGKQNQLFDRRFAKRIEELRRKDVLLNGKEVGFDAIALKVCSRNAADFDMALRKFESQLAIIEREFSDVR